jgi:hypothetical protein
MLFLDLLYNIVVSNDAKIEEVYERPSKREIINYVSEARDAIKVEKRQILFQRLLSRSNDLEINDTDLRPLLIMLLEEILEIGPNSLYAGKRPPEKSYEVGLEGPELWAYVWDSKLMRSRMYLKFSMKKGYYFYMGCHKSKY